MGGSARRGRGGRGGAPSMLARASLRAGDGAGLLFTRLAQLGTPHEDAADALERLATRIRAGAWNAQIAEAAELAAAAERALAPEG